MSDWDKVHNQVGHGRLRYLSPLQEDWIETLLYEKVTRILLDHD